MGLTTTSDHYSCSQISGINRLLSSPALFIVMTMCTQDASVTFTLDTDNPEFAIFGAMASAPELIS